MKRHYWFEGSKNGLVVVSGGPDEGGWYIKRGKDAFHPSDKPWRRYYPPGYDGLKGVKATIIRRAAGGPWYVEMLEGPLAYQPIGPFPSKARAMVVARMNREATE